MRSAGSCCPPIFRFVARQPELVLVGALAWCFALAGFAGYLDLSPEMGALIAGVMLSTFPYTLDVIAKVTTLRDFFVTLFFVGLGMSIPVPTLNRAVDAVRQRLRRREPLPHRVSAALRDAARPSHEPAARGQPVPDQRTVARAARAGQGQPAKFPRTRSASSRSPSRFSPCQHLRDRRNDSILRALSPSLARLGLPDLPADRHGRAGARAPAPHLHPRLFPGPRVRSSRRSRARKPQLLRDLCRRRLQSAGERAAATARRRRDLRRHRAARHAAARRARARGNHRLLDAGHRAERLEQPAPVRQFREINTDAQIIVHAERLSEIEGLYAAGASYVSAPRLLEAHDLLRAVEAAESAPGREERTAATPARCSRRSDS